jgi:hypothetical protein
MNQTRTVTAADILAAVDILDDVGESSDSLTVEDAVVLLQAVEEVMAAARRAVGLLNTQLVATLESPRQFGNKVYEIVNDGKWRPEHGAVKAAVKIASVVDANGELRHPTDAVERCMSLLYALYVSPSQMPKVGGLDALGLDKADVAEFDRAGRKVRVTEIVEEP